MGMVLATAASHGAFRLAGGAEQDCERRRTEQKNQRPGDYTAHETSEFPGHLSSYYISLRLDPGPLAFCRRCRLGYNLVMSSIHQHAGCWFLRSGIQEPNGGVARYFLADPGKNLPVSSEITGYAVSTLVYLHSISGQPASGQTAFLDSAIRAARFLTEQAWDSDNSTFPFEPGSDRAYFFDVGIIARGLLSAWRVSGEEVFLARAREAALSLAFDFLGEGVFHPVISLPDKQPLPHESRWSRRPGCYQLKAALAWREIGDDYAAKLFESVLASALATHASYLPNELSKDLSHELDREAVMDRLHPYCYFLEGLLAVADRADVRHALGEGVVRAGALFREIAPQFERSDVAAQLLRVRLIAHHLGALPLDEPAAREEAEFARSCQAGPEERNLRLQGGFYFGKRRGALLPFSNPVSTGFCMQALELWQQHEANSWRFDLPQLI